MKRTLKLLTAVSILALSLALGSATANAANTADLEFYSPYPTQTGSCEYTFDRTPWSGSGPWTSHWDNFNEVTSNCASPGVVDEFTFDVTKGVPSGGIGTANVVITAKYSIPVFGFTVSCTYRGSGNGFWVEFPGRSYSQLILPAVPVNTLVGGSALCPSSIVSDIKSGPKNIIVDN